MQAGPAIILILVLPLIAVYYRVISFWVLNTMNFVHSSFFYFDIVRSILEMIFIAYRLLVVPLVAVYLVISFWL